MRNFINNMFLMMFIMFTPAMAFAGGGEYGVFKDVEEVLWFGYFFLIGIGVFMVVGVMVSGCEK